MSFRRRPGVTAAHFSVDADQKVQASALANGGRLNGVVGNLVGEVEVLGMARVDWTDGANLSWLVMLVLDGIVVGNENSSFFEGDLPTVDWNPATRIVDDSFDFDDVRVGSEVPVAFHIDRH